MSGARRVSILFLLLAFALRIWRLDTDPPPADLIRDEAPWTDEGTIADPVIRAIRSGVGCGSLAFVGGRSLHQVMLCNVFQHFGIAKLTGRQLTALFGMIGLSVLGWMGWTIWPKYGAQLTYGLAGTGFLYVIFDRLLLTEGILIALLTCCACLGIIADRRWQGFLVGCLLGTLAMGFKLHALALAPALLAMYLLRRRRIVTPFALGLVLVVFVWRACLVPGATISRMADVPSRVVDSTMGLADPLGVLQQIWWSGISARFFPNQVPILVFASIDLVACLLRPGRWVRSASTTMLVALPWFVVALLGRLCIQIWPGSLFSLCVTTTSASLDIWNATSLGRQPFPRRFTHAPSCRVVGVRHLVADAGFLSCIGSRQMAGVGSSARSATTVVHVLALESAT